MDEIKTANQANYSLGDSVKHVFERSHQALRFLEHWSKRLDITRALLSAGFNLGQPSHSLQTNLTHKKPKQLHDHHANQSPQNASAAEQPLKDHTESPRSDTPLPQQQDTTNTLTRTTQILPEASQYPSNNTLTLMTQTDLHRLESPEQYMNIIHHTGCCGPSAFGLVYAQCLTQGAFTNPDNHTIYQEPLQLFQRYFSLYYQVKITSIDELITRLSQKNHHQIQWLMAPIMRLILHTLLVVNVRDCSEDFFICDDFFSNIEWPQSLQNKLTDALILESKHRLHAINHDPSMAKTRHDHLLCARYYLTQDDLLVISRLLRVELSIHQRCTTNEAMQHFKEAMLEQSRQNHMAQNRFYRNHYPQRVTMTLFHEIFLLANEGISGHFDVLSRDPNLTQSVTQLQLFTPDSDDVRNQIEPVEQIAHVDPGLLLDILPTLGMTHPTTTNAKIIPATISPSQATTPPQTTFTPINLWHTHEHEIPDPNSFSDVAKKLFVDEIDSEKTALNATSCPQSLWETNPTQTEAQDRQPLKELSPRLENDSSPTALTDHDSEDDEVSILLNPSNRL